jgi:hypothetical protein
MRPQFPIFQNHKDHVHALWSSLLRPGSIVCDATCGNGQDSAILASLCLDDTSGKLFCIDIQQQAIASTKSFLNTHVSKKLLSKVSFFCQSHEIFPSIIPPCDLIVYNLGYLPRGSKLLTTMVTSTLTSLKNALNLLKDGGVITLMCYPGHEEGLQEELNLINFTTSLDPKEYLVYYQKIVNRAKAPTLLVIGKKIK